MTYKVLFQNTDKQKPEFVGMLRDAWNCCGLVNLESRNQWISGKTKVDCRYVSELLEHYSLILFRLHILTKDKRRKWLTPVCVNEIEEDNPQI